MQGGACWIKCLVVVVFVRVLTGMQGSCSADHGVPASLVLFVLFWVLIQNCSGFTSSGAMGLYGVLEIKLGSAM